MAAIELLGQLEERLGSPGLTVRGTVDGNVKRFLFDLVSYRQKTQEGSRSAGRNVERSAFAVRFHFCVGGDESEFHGSMFKAEILAHCYRDS